MRGFSFYFALFIVLTVNLSWQWPVKKTLLTSTFGESRADHFHDGVDLVNSSGDIYPVAKGKLLFEWNSAYFPGENYWGGGNYKLIKHEKNMVSLYMHLEDGAPHKVSYTAQEKIGKMGNTGHSFGRHLHFCILDLDKRVSINPMLLLPKYEDNKAPEVMAIGFKIKDRYVQIKDNADIRLTQNYPLLVQIRDTISGRERLGIYKIQAVINGKKILFNKYDKLNYSPQGLENDGHDFYFYYDEIGYYKVEGIEYRSGENVFEISAWDFNGNEVKKIYKINVTLDF